MAIKRSHHDGSADQATAAGAASQALATEPLPSGLPAALSAPSGAAPGVAPQSLPLGDVPALGAPPPAAPAAVADNGPDTSARGSHKKHAHPVAFGNGPVHHGNVLHLKMDGPIEAIEGASQPTGFTVKLPGRKSLEAAGPLAARDARIAAIKVSNDSAGAELTVVFKDGVPNYQVNGKGDTLVIAIAPPGMLDKTVAKKDEKGGKSPKHAKHHKHDDDGAGASSSTGNAKP